MDIYTLPNVKQIASGKQLRSTGRSAWCFVTTWRGGVGGWEGNAGGRGCGDVCMHIADSLCCTMEARYKSDERCVRIQH